MKTLHTAFALICSLLCFSSASAQESFKSLGEELFRLNTDSALVIASQGVDEYPLWSPDARYLAASIMGVWQKVDLGSLRLATATWRGGETIGVLNSISSLSRAAPEDVAHWKKSNRVFPDEVTTASGVTVRLKREGPGTSLAVQKQGGDEEVLWTSDTENCHSLVLSPEEDFVAFICEMNGVVVMKVPE